MHLTPKFYTYNLGNHANNLTFFTPAVQQKLAQALLLLLDAPGAAEDVPPGGPQEGSDEDDGCPLSFARRTARALSSPAHSSPEPSDWDREISPPRTEPRWARLARIRAGGGSLAGGGEPMRRDNARVGDGARALARRLAALRQIADRAGRDAPRGHASGDDSGSEGGGGGSEMRRAARGDVSAVAQQPRRSVRGCRGRLRGSS